ncbi:snRNA-activating protein complex subunit 2 [Poecilia reticulata]|uniref:Small nuclear RNA activating complex polypeptide 2 n=1 Tax=Poecilia reticulata TaxID=8081 RepID=A0A3P9N4L6_POERE|nr:PREDICTED: snRNA-activating protein complex subunit 2 [Poecilia reticulata]
MKPPPRNRIKRELSFWSETPKSRRNTNCKWGRPELKKLLKALKALSQTTGGGLQEIDYAVLKKDIPTRSISEISDMVDSLKNKTISSARFQLRMKNWEEKQFSRPIEEWTHMASTLAGTLEKVISAAFCQMLVVSSTEPCTLRNCDPKQDPRPAAVCRPVPCVGEQPSAVLLMAPAPAGSGSRRLPAPSQAVRTPTRRILPRQKQPAVPSTAAASTLLTGSPTPSAPLLSETLPAFVSPRSLKPLAPSTSGLSSVSAAAQSAVVLCLPVSSFSSPHSTLPLSNTAAELPATSRQSSKHAAVGGPETVGVNFAVDFEKIYKFLTVVQNPSEDYNLTPMESAIVLDLLMSLPEELHYLDCKNLQKHLIQMHQSLSAPDSSMPAKQLMSKLRTARRVERGPVPAGHPSQRCSQEAETAGAAGRGASSGQSEDADMSDFLPPLNPFLVPLSLLTRKQSSE